MSSKTNYTGRFAPSPSGPLHFGSLIAALASFLDARSQGGKWLLRMEDLDPAREPPEAADQILRCLEHFQLHWDDEIVYQSKRLDAYADALQALSKQGLIYPCDCTRQQIQALGGVYDNRCRERTKNVLGSALRVRTDNIDVRFNDRVQGPQSQNLLSECGDFVLLRKDGLFAYQLAVVVDDAFQNITDIVRGSDLLPSTPRQIYLQRCLSYAEVRYAHIPVAVNELGQKLSKQHFAQAVDASKPVHQIVAALRFLGQKPDPALKRATLDDALGWAIQHWDIQAVPKLANIQLESA